MVTRMTIFKDMATRMTISMDMVTRMTISMDMVTRMTISIHILLTSVYNDSPDLLYTVVDEQWSNLNNRRLLYIIILINIKVKSTNNDNVYVIYIELP